MNFGYFTSYSSLHPKLAGDNPDDSFSTVPYEKGYQFLVSIESLIGEFKMKELLNNWISQNAYKSVKWDDFRNHVEYFIDVNFGRSEAAKLK